MNPDEEGTAVKKQEPVRIALLVPCTSRKRNDWKTPKDSYLLRYLLASLVETRTVSASISYHVLLGVDAGDRIYDCESMREETAKVTSEHADITFEYVPLAGIELGHVTAMWNRLFQVALDDRTRDFEFFYQCGDDITFHAPGWVAECIRVARSWPGGVGVCGPDDAKTSRILTQAFVTRAHYHAFGHFFPPEIRNWHCDDWLTEVYEGEEEDGSTDCHRLFEYKCSNMGGNPRYSGQRADDMYKMLVERDRAELASFRNKCELLPHHNCSAAEALATTITTSNNNNKVAVCIEPRRHPAMSFVLAEFAKHLGTGWHFVLVAGVANAEWMQQVAEQTPLLFSFEVRVLPTENLTIDDYSRLLLSPQFWRQMPAEHVLVFQTDSIPVGSSECSTKPEDFFEFDYVGAPWSWDVDGRGVRVGNGGLSLRKRSSSIQATLHKGVAEWGEKNEDGYFARFFFHNEGYSVPSAEVAARFSIETMTTGGGYGGGGGDNSSIPPPWGIHKSWQYIPETLAFPNVTKLFDLQGELVPPAVATIEEKIKTTAEEKGDALLILPPTTQQQQQYTGRVHVIAPFGSVVSPEFSVCAFTHHVRTLPDMLHLYGWHVTEYSNEGSTSAADEHAVALTRKQLDALKVGGKGSTVVPSKENGNHRLKAAFYGKVLSELKKRCKAGDIVCHIYGPRKEIASALPKCHHVESHVGYPTYPPHGLRFRIFATNAWMHVNYGHKETCNGDAYTWVAPLAFYAEEWTVRNSVPDSAPVVFLGRITGDKGIATIIEVAKCLPELQFIVCGPGSTLKWVLGTAKIPNFRFKPPITGHERDAFLGQARCVLMPTSYVEPFGASGVEAMLCGTPLIGSTFGGFTETIDHGVNGFRCRTRQDWVEAIRAAGSLNRSEIARVARQRYSIGALAPTFDQAFRQMRDLNAGPGWYATESHDRLLNGQGFAPTPPPLLALAAATTTAAEAAEPTTNKKNRNHRKKKCMQQPTTTTTTTTTPTTAAAEEVPPPPLSLVVSGTACFGSIQAPENSDQATMVYVVNVVFPRGGGGGVAEATTTTRHWNARVAFNQLHSQDLHRARFRVTLVEQTSGECTQLKLTIARGAASSSIGWDAPLDILVDCVRPPPRSCFIPRTIYQTFHTKSLVPQHIYDAVERFAPEFEHNIFEDDACCAFLRRYFGDTVRDRFLVLQGAHRADLFRYCVLYVMGGYYFDISTLLTHPLDEMFASSGSSSSPPPSWFTVISGVARTLHQGVLVSAAGNPYLRQAIHHCMTVDPTYYSVYVEYLYKMVAAAAVRTTTCDGGVETKEKLASGLHTLHDQSIGGGVDCGVSSSSSASYIADEKWSSCYLFQERALNGNAAKGMPPDKYGYYCTIHDHSGKEVAKTRDPTYPWQPAALHSL